MERLTKIYPSGAWGIAGELDDAILRLAAYEETGLEPEEIELLAKQRGLYVDACGELPLKRIRELAKADREGRCVALPCEISHKLYDITGGEIVEKSIVFIPLLLTRTANHLSLSALDQRDAITAIVTQYSGNTVFLPRAAAEAALRREQDD